MFGIFTWIYELPSKIRTEFDFYHQNHLPAINLTLNHTSGSCQTKGPYHYFNNQRIRYS